MAKRKKKPTEQRRSSTAFVFSADFDDLCVSEYTSLADSPEVQTCAFTIAELISSMTIHLMKNGKNGDERIENALSRKVDIDPIQTMTRKTWMTSIIMNLLLYGKGNSIVMPHTYNGYIQSLEPISASRVALIPKENSFRDYYVQIDGKLKKPEDVLHFVYNPDRVYLWKGRGVNVLVSDIANSLKQARKTEKAFMESKWKPSVIVKVDAMASNFKTAEGRQKILDSYVKSQEIGEPWLIPSEQFQVEQIRPLSLTDLAIDSTMELDKRTIAAIFGVPPFILGVGNYDRNEWNKFINTKVHSIAQIVEQELTKKLILSEEWYFRMNIWKLLDYDLATTASVMNSLADRGFANGNEVRDKVGLVPREGLDEYKVLENYIPIDMSGNQKKLVQED